jgi:hypothetical protein
MKKIIAIVTLMTAVASFAGTSSSMGSLYIKGITEADVVANAEAAAMDMASQRDVRWRAQSDNCNIRRKGAIKVGNLTLKKVYINNNGIFSPEFRGSLSYTLKFCRDRD